MRAIPQLVSAPSNPIPIVYRCIFSLIVLSEKDSAMKDGKNYCATV